MPTGTLFAWLAVVLLGVTFALALLALVRPGRIHVAFSLLVALVALGTMGSFEFVREAIRKPYVIGNYLYANSLYANQMPGDGGFSGDQVNGAGVLKTAKWISNREVTPDNQIAVGREIFRVECQSCHTPNSYRGIKGYLALRQWDQNKTQAMLGGLEFMHNSVMPPFAGTDVERGALAAYLSTIEPISANAAVAATDGKTIFEQNCSMCHRVSGADPLFKKLPQDPDTEREALKDLTGLFPLMPDLKLSDQQRTALVQWINTQRSTMRIPVAAQGGN
jgi:mono/diheme cytochrome c family protein